MPPPQVFISHAHSDGDLVFRFLELLSSGVGVEPERIFCTSSASQGVRVGKNFTTEIQQALTRSRVSIALVSEAFYQSTYCLCELGAMWGRSKSLIPILIPPVDFNDMRAVISGLQPIVINEAKSMDKLVEELSTALELPRPSISRWNTALRAFLSEFPKFYRASERARRLGVRFLDHYMLPISHAVSNLIASQDLSAESSLYLILLDIDRQKHINSKHGISVGDRVLSQAHQLVTKKRDGVIFSDRCGDDTFFLLFVGSKDSTEALCNMLLKSVREVAAEVRKDDLWVTASIGACKYTIECRLDSWKSNTHRALVEARKEGGNAVKFGVAPQPHERTPDSWGS